MTYKSKLLFFILTATTLAVVLPFYVDVTWHAWLIIPLVCYLTKGFGSEIGAHRLFTHRSFDTTDRWKKSMTVLQTLCGEGSIFGFVGVHRLHHLHSDTDKDPHCPKKGLFKVTFYQHDIRDFDIRLIKDLFKEPWLVSQHKNYFVIQITIMLVLAMLSPLVLWYYSVNVISTLWINFLVNVVCHRWGTNDNKLNNNSKNNRWADFFLLGVGLHNNHHLHPGASNLAWPPYRFDVWAQIIQLIKR